MGVKHYLWRTVDHEGEVLESFVTKRRDKKAALNRRSAERILQKFAAVHGSVHNQFASRTFGSTRNDTSHPGQHSRNAARLLLTSGANFARPD